MKMMFIYFLADFYLVFVIFTKLLILYNIKMIKCIIHRYMSFFFKIFNFFLMNI